MAAVRRAAVRLRAAAAAAVATPLRLGTSAAAVATPLRVRAGALATSAAAVALAGHNGIARAEAVDQSMRIISAAEQEDIAANLIENISIPFLPRVILDAVLVKVVAAVVETLQSANLDSNARAAIRQAAKAQSAGADEETMMRLAQDVSKRLDLPLLTHTQQHALVLQVLSVMLGDTTLSGSLLQGAASAHRTFGRMLLSPTSRKALATKINEAVDLPMLSEQQEQRLFEAAVEALGTAIDSIIPAELQKMLDGLDASEIGLLKASTTQRLVETVKLPVPVPLPAATIHTLVSATVDALFSCLLDTELGSSALAPEDQLVRVRRLEAEAQAEAAFLQRKSEREQRQYRGGWRRWKRRRRQSRMRFAATAVGSDDAR